MHAPIKVSMGEARGEPAIVMDDPSPLPSPDAAPVSVDSKEAGLWLWQGDTPEPPSVPRPKSRDQKICHRILHAAGWAGWIALPAGMALTFIALSAARHPDRPVSADAPAAAVSSVPSATVAPALQAEPIETQSDRAQVPSAPAANVTTRGPEPRMAEWHVQRKSSPAKKNHATHMHNAPPILKPGVLTPPMTWDGDGY
jgi:hypothetical protein